LFCFPIFFLPLFFEVPAVFYLLIWFFSQLFSGTAALAGPQQVGRHCVVGAHRRIYRRGCFSADYLRDEVANATQMNTPWSGLEPRSA